MICRLNVFTIQKNVKAWKHDIIFLKIFHFKYKASFIAIHKQVLDYYCKALFYYLQVNREQHNIIISLFFFPSSVSC